MNEDRQKLQRMQAAWLSWDIACQRNYRANRLIMLGSMINTILVFFLIGSFEELFSLNVLAMFWLILMIPTILGLFGFDLVEDSGVDLAWEELEEVMDA